MLEAEPLYIMNFQTIQFGFVTCFCFVLQPFRVHGVFSLREHFILVLVVFKKNFHEKLD